MSAPLGAPLAASFVLTPALAAGLLTTVPVFLQAPLVRVAPMAAILLTLPLVLLGVLLERCPNQRWQPFGPLLVGFCGSWLAGCLFWGWCRLHPLWHLPLEGFALPLALAGLSGRWRIAGAFYLASLVGTAATDLAIASTGLMPCWPQILASPMPQAALLLRQAGEVVMRPANLGLTLLLAGLLIHLSLRLWKAGVLGRISAVTLATTLLVDGLFLLSALLAPRLSGLI